MTAVPFVNLQRGLDDPAARELADYLSSLPFRADFVGGPQVERFEEAFAGACLARHCVGVASGLDALRLALLALDGVDLRGGEVVVPAMTFVATYEAVVQAGGKPVPADVDADTGLVRPDAVQAALGPASLAIVPVHLYGQMADVHALEDIGNDYGVPIVEDAAQAHGATRDGLGPGERSAAAAFSFYPTKPLGAFGDAGAVVTDRDDVAEAARSLREHGRRAGARGVHDLVGYTARLDSIQAEVLRVKLPRLVSWNRERAAAAEWYAQALDGVGDLVLPALASDDSEPAWHLFVVRTAEPDALAEFLRGRGVGTGRHYPAPPPLEPAFAYLGHKQGEFPAAEDWARRGLSLPIWPGIRQDELEQVAAAVRGYFDG